MKILIVIITVLWTSLAFGGEVARLTLVASYNTGLTKGTEIINIQQLSKIAVVSNSEQGVVDLLDLTDPVAPSLIQRIHLDLAVGEELTAVDIHPHLNYFLAAVQASGVHQVGRVEAREIPSGRLLATFDTGVGPDGLAIAPNGKSFVVPNEGEYFTYSSKHGVFNTSSGSFTLVYLNNEDLPASRVVQIAIQDQTARSGWVEQKHQRNLKRDVDWNGNGIIDAEVDFNHDGIITSAKIKVGLYQGEVIWGKESKGESFLFPLNDNSPGFLEPERVAYSPDSTMAYVVFQEANGVAMIHVESGKVLRYFGLGTTTHLADIRKDSSVVIDQLQVFLREPDGIAVTLDGRYLLTADEGDTDSATKKISENMPIGGGRTMSIFDAHSGVFIADTGDQLDKHAALVGVYPDKRSAKKGSEPETVKAVSLRGISYAIVALERADALALISLQDIHAPLVLQVVPVHKKSKIGSQAPEGLAYLHQTDGSYYIYCANEKSGTVTVFHLF